MNMYMRPPAKPTITRHKPNDKDGAAPDQGSVGAEVATNGRLKKASVAHIAATDRAIPTSRWPPTRGSRNLPASRRVQEMRLAGDRFRTWGSSAIYEIQAIQPPVMA